jgi:uncharacterized Zn finger protein (UPF0148 family)
MGMARASLIAVLTGRGGSMMMAVRAANVAGIPVETILSGALLVANRCPHCGQQLPPE